MIVFDVEIKKAIPPRGNEKFEPGIEYCGGWRDFQGMGIACVSTYDIHTHLTRVFLEEDLDDLKRYLDGRVTAGFNTKRFDIQLLAAHGVHVATVLTSTATRVSNYAHYDILEQVWLALDLDPDNFNPRTHGGWSLDAICAATIGEMKSGNGALAPILWQRGQRGKVIDYCCRDSWLEAQLLDYIIRTESVVNPKTGTDLMLKTPAQVLAV